MQLVTYCSLLTREMFLRAYFVRTFVLSDTLAKTLEAITTFRQDPNSIPRIRDMMNECAKSVSVMKSLWQYLDDSLKNRPIPAATEGDELHAVLSVHKRKEDITLRVVDLEKLIVGLALNLSSMQQMTATIDKSSLEATYTGVMSNTNFLVNAADASIRSAASLEIMQVILAMDGCCVTHRVVIRCCVIRCIMQGPRDGRLLCHPLCHPLCRPLHHACR